MLFHIADMPANTVKAKVLSFNLIRQKSKVVDIKEDQPVATLPEGLIKTVWSMVKTCLAEDGVGLAAPQIGVFKRMFIIREKEDYFRLYINPTYMAGNKKEEDWEGCLSVPGRRIKVSRFIWINTTWLDGSYENRMTTFYEELEGYKARVFQHEFNHLDGISILEASKMR